MSFLSFSFNTRWKKSFHTWRFEERRGLSVLTALGSHEMICMHACSLPWWFDNVSMSLWKPVGLCVCVVSPGLAVCVSDVNSVLSARFSTLPAAVKTARPSLPPPRGLISFFILSAIQLVFLRGHRRQEPFPKKDEPGDSACTLTFQKTLEGCHHTRIFTGFIFWRENWRFGVTTLEQKWSSNLVRSIAFCY